MQGRFSACTGEKRRGGDNPRMPLLLGRYLVGELLRVLLVTTVVLVTVIAFGAAIKPLANNSLLDASQTLKYVLLATVPMLQFALPFASGFAATLVMHRLTSDNEILAIRASGMSYSKILTPIAGVGLALTIIMLLLTQAIIPTFWEIMRSTIATDVTRLFQSTIDRDQPFQMGDLQIYADELVVDDDPGEADARLRLWGVAAAQLDEKGRIVTDVTANQAVVDIYREHGTTWILIKMSDAVAYRHATRELVSAPEIVPNRPIPIASEVDDDPMFMSRGELLQLRRDPDHLASVQRRIRALAEALEVAEQQRMMAAQLAQDGRLTFTSASPPRTYVLRATEMRHSTFPGSQDDPVRVVQLIDGQPRRELTARDAELLPVRVPATGELAFDLELLNVQVRDLAQPDSTNQRERLVLAGLTAPGATASDLADLGSGALLERARQLHDPPGPVREAFKDLARKLVSLQHEITARMQQRYALSVTALLLLMLGSTLALLLRDSQPLHVYLWAFLPSLLDLMLISAGDQLTRDGGAAGPIVLWSGNALLCAMCIAAFIRLRRH